MPFRDDRHSLVLQLDAERQRAQLVAKEEALRTRELRNKLMAMERKNRVLRWTRSEREGPISGPTISGRGVAVVALVAALVLIPLLIRGSQPACASSAAVNKVESSVVCRGEGSPRCSKTP